MVAVILWVIIVILVVKILNIFWLFREKINVDHLTICVILVFLFSFSKGSDICIFLLEFWIQDRRHPQIKGGGPRLALLVKDDQGGDNLDEEE